MPALTQNSLYNTLQIWVCAQPACIRPPQSQSRTNIFFILVCTEDTNGINSCYTKSLWYFYWRAFFLFLCFFGVFFSCRKPLFLDFQQEKLSYNADIVIPYCNKSPLLKKEKKTKFCLKILKWKKTHYLCTVMKNHKTFGPKKF